jgi:hypothetical protein
VIPRIAELAGRLGCTLPRVPAREDPESLVPVLVSGGQLRDDWFPFAEPPAIAAEQAELLDGQLAALATGGKYRTLALADLANSSSAEWTELERRGLRNEIESQALAALLEPLGARQGALRCAALVTACERSELATVRAHAARLLAIDPTEEWIVPRLLLRLKYETDHEAAIEVARALAVRGNFAGIAALREVARAPSRAELGARAAEVAAGLATSAGCSDAAELERAWIAGELRVERALEPALELELQRRIELLRAWQLRYVDDARHVLANFDGRAASLLGAALADTDRYIRVHAAQCLQRMGPRAIAAENALIAALCDPAVAPQAAGALGALRSESARQELQRCAAEAELPELCSAAQRALADSSR